MFNISSFLEKFSKNISAQESQTKKICDAVFKHTEIVLDPKNIKIQNAILYLQISPAEKSKIFIRKKQIIDNITKAEIKIINIR